MAVRVSQEVLCFFCDKETKSNSRRLLSQTSTTQDVSNVLGFLQKTNVNDNLPSTCAAFYLCKSCFAKVDKCAKYDNYIATTMNEIQQCFQNKGNLLSTCNETIVSIGHECIRRTVATQTEFIHLIETDHEVPATSGKKRSADDDLFSTPKHPRVCHSQEELSTSSTVLKVIQKKRGKRTRRYLVPEHLKDFVKTFKYTGSASTLSTKSLFKSVPSSTAIYKCVNREISKECLAISSSNNTIFRVMDFKKLNFINMESLKIELQKAAPVLYSVLTAATGSRTTNKGKDILIMMAAAILLKARNKNLCLLQSLIGSVLYAGHASKEVYKRLNRLGVSVSHTTMTKLVGLCRKGYDKNVRKWQKQWSKTISRFNSPLVSPDEDELTSNETENEQAGSYILVGDNLDKTVTPRTITMDHQVQSLHYFNSYAALDRVDFSMLDTKNSINTSSDIMSIPISALLPNTTDCNTLRYNYIILVSNIITSRLSHFKFLFKCIPKIGHLYEEEMNQKSQTVCLGVIPKNENKKDDMIEILRQLQLHYVPVDSSKQPISIGLSGDQLTCERARESQDIRKHSFNVAEQLGGFVPFAGDWHAEAILLQIFYDRLYKGGCSQEGGTLIQLRNLINRRNVAANTSGRFNASVDFFEMVSKCHIIASALSFFGMDDVSSKPSRYNLPRTIQQWSLSKQWEYFSGVIGKLIDRFVLVQDYVAVSDNGDTSYFPLEDTSYFTENFHCKRIVLEHSYCCDVLSEECTRQLPAWLQESSQSSSKCSYLARKDGVYSYACAVMTDGLLLMELRDAIHCGDGPRILRCWKFMLLYFKHYKHHKYALEALRLLIFTNGLSSPLVKEQMTWSRTVNIRGGSGHNIPVDLYNEHLNRTLKCYITGLGANVSEEAIVHISQSLQSLHSICRNLDNTLDIPPKSLHHTNPPMQKDENAIIDELVNKSRVFEYVPGRCHHSFSNVQPLIGKAINASNLIQWVNNQKKKIKMDFEFHQYLRSN